MLTTDEERYLVILDSIKSARSNGISIGAEAWGIGWNRNQDKYTPTNSKTCCPLGCTLLTLQASLPRHIDYREWSIETILNVNSAWIKGFIAGFDLKNYDRSFNREAFNLGYKMRDELLPIKSK
jgi:hypothetical protein